MTPEDFIVFIVDDDAAHARGAVRAARIPGLARRRLGVSGRICIVPKARPAGLSDPRRRAARHQRPGLPEADFARRSSSDRFHHRARRHSVVGARHQGRRGRLSDQAVHRARSGRGNPIGGRSGSDGSAERAELETLRERLGSLTPREREVLPLVVSGLLNKQAAAELGISEVTLQIHRSKIMQKMEAASLADLVRIAEKLQIPITHSRRAGSS